MLLRNFSLQTKLLLVLTVVNLISVVSFISYAQYAKTQDIRQQIDNRLRTAAYAVPRVLGDNYLDRARKADGLKEGEYLSQVRNLGEYAGDVDLKYAYSMMVDAQGQVYYLADGSSAADIDCQRQLLQAPAALHRRQPCCTGCCAQRSGAVR